MSPAFRPSPTAPASSATDPYTRPLPAGSTPRDPLRPNPWLTGEALNPASSWPTLACLIALVIGLGCTPATPDEDTLTPTLPPSGDLTGPTIDFTPLSDGQPAGAEVTVRVRLTDPSGISAASLFYRAPGTDFWGSAFFTSSGTDPDAFVTTIPASFVQSLGVDYYIKAIDASPNRNSSLSPELGPSAPYHFDIEEITATFPYHTSFEPPSGVTDWRLADTGWTEYVQGFDDGLTWQLVQDPDSGAWSVYHDHGSPYQEGEFLDFLVSPSLDLSGVTEAALSWRERMDYSVLADHGLYLSTGSPDPADGDFLPLLEPLLPTLGSEDAWARSLYVDLSPWAGQPQVYIAFSYAGRQRDDWWLDDVAIEAPVPALVAGPLETFPQVVSPGDQASVTVRVSNEGLASSGPLTARLVSPDPSVIITPEEQALPGLAFDEQASLTFQLEVDDLHPDNTWVPLTLTVIQGETPVQVQGRLQVGLPPRAEIAITHAFEHDLQVFLGYGDPANPSFYQVVQQDEGGDASGTFTWVVDVASQAAALPPDNGSHRWFLEVWDDSVGNTGTVDAFALAVGETRYESQGLPLNIPDDRTPVYIFLPGRAAMELETAVTTPEVLAPGNDVSLVVSLKDTAAPPQGPLEGTLSTQDTAVRKLNGGPVAFEYTPLEIPDAGVKGQVTQLTPFTFRVDPGHVDSQPLTFTLTLTDGVDSWQVPLSLPVPYPVLAGLSVAFEDANTLIPDQALEVGESAWLRLRVRNAGALATFGSVAAQLSLKDDGGTGVVIDSASYILADDLNSAVLPAGSGGKSVPINIYVPRGQNGDRIVLGIHLSDGVIDVEETRTITLGEVPWNPLTPVEDDSGDAQDYPIDLRAGEFQLQGSTILLRWRAWSPFDISETWLYSYLSAYEDYQYALVYALGEARIYAWYRSGDTGYWYRRSTVPSSLIARQPDSTTLELGINLADLGLTQTVLWGGASVGACNGPVACDYAPDSAQLGAGLTRFWW